MERGLSVDLGLGFDFGGLLLEEWWLDEVEVLVLVLVEGARWWGGGWR